MYEYEVWKHLLSDPIRDLKTMLNDLGRDGWEIFHMHEVAFHGVAYMLVFGKRALHGKRTRK